MRLRILLFLLIVGSPAALLAGQEKSHVDRFSPPQDLYRQREAEASAILLNNPADFEALRQRATARLRLGNLKGAWDDLNLALQVRPDSAQILADLAYLNWLRGDYPGGLQKALGAIELDPQLSSAHFYAGKLLLLSEGDVTTAVDHLERALELNPFESDIRFDLLTAYRAMGDSDRATVQLRILQASLPPEHDRLLYASGLIAADLGQMDLAIERFSKALEANPEMPGLRLDLAAALLQMEKWERAAQTLASYPNLATSAEVLHMYALALYNGGRVPEAEIQIARAIQADPAYSPTYTLLGILLASRGEHSRAVSLFERSRQLDERSFDTLFYLGRSHFALRNLEDAIASLAQAQQLRPDHAETRFFLATALESAGRTNEAANLYRQLIEDSPGDARAAVGLASLLVKRGESAQAIPLLQRAITTDPDHFEAHLSLGRAYFQEGEYPPAIEVLQRAVELAPGSVDAHNQLAQALLRSGQPEAAQKEFAIVKQLNDELRSRTLEKRP